MPPKHRFAPSAAAVQMCAGCLFHILFQPRLQQRVVDLKRAVAEFADQVFALQLSDGALHGAHFHAFHAQYPGGLLSEFSTIRAHLPQRHRLQQQPLDGA